MFNRLKTGIIILLLLVITGGSYVSASDKGLIGDLFDWISSGTENGSGVTDVWRLNGENIKDETLTTNEIKDGEVKTSDIATAAVVNSKLADNAVDNRALKNDEIFDMTGANISDNLIVNGKIGVGTDNPQSKLDIQGGNLKLLYDGRARIDLYGDASSETIKEDVAIGFNKIGESTFATIAGENIGNGKGDLKFLTDDGSNHLERMRITSSGNVGVGTGAPQAKLDVAGNIEATTDYGDKVGLGGDLNADDSEVYIKAPEDRNKIVFWNRTLGERTDIKAAQGRFKGGVYTKGSDLDYMSLEGENMEFGHIDGSGSVLSRDAKIDQYGNFHVGTKIPKNSGSLTYPDYGNKLYFGGGPSGSTYDSENSDKLWLARYNKSKDVSELRINVGDNPSYGNLLDAFNIGVTTSDFESLMYIRSDGNVGIGTDDPNYTLDVNGSSSISGSLNVANAVDIGGDVNIDGSLSVSGVTNLNNLYADNLVLSGSISFLDSENVPWMDKDSNLPFIKFGSTNYIEPQILGSFEGQILTAITDGFLFYEEDGTLIGLRPGYNGVNAYMYYMYSEEGEYDKLSLTNMEYKPDFLKGKDEKVTAVLGGGEDNIIVFTTDFNEVYKGAYLIRDINTMNPIIHTNEKVVNIKSIIDTMEHDMGTTIVANIPSVRCTYIKEESLIACGIGNGKNYLYLYKINDDKSLTRISLHNTIENIDDAIVFFDPTDINNNDYMEYVGNIIPDRVDIYRQYETPILDYYIDGDILYIDFMSIPYIRNISKKIGKRPLFNLIYKLSISDIDSDNKANVNYENQLPLKYDLEKNENKSADKYSISTGVQYGDQIILNYYFEKKDFILSYFSTSLAPTFFYIHKYASFTNKLDFFKNVKGFYDNIRQLDGTTAYVGRALYTPYDPSYLGKSLGYSRFLAADKVLTYAYSNLYNIGEGYHSVKVTLKGDSFNRQVPVYSVLKDAMPLPKKIEKADDYGNFRQTLLKQNGDIVAYYEEGGKLYKTTNGGAISNFATLPSDYKTTIEGDLKNDPNYRYNGNEPDEFSYSVKVINDDYLLVDYVFQYKKSDGLNLLRYNWLIYNISNLSIKKRGDKLDYEPGVLYYIYYPGYMYRGNITWNFSTTYIDKNDNIYIEFSNPYIGMSGASHKKYRLLKLNSSFQVQDDKFYLYHRMYERYSLGIHPLYGPYMTHSNNDSFSKTTFYYVDHTSESDLDTRITACFEDMISDTSTSRLGMLRNNVGVMITAQQAEGFTIYTSDTPFFIDGLYTKIGVGSYDLTDPQYGLVTTAGDETPLKNKLIYISVNPNQDLTNPKLSFSLTEPATPILAMAQTNEYGITSIIIKDGLDITTPTVYIKTLNISHYIEMRGEDNKWYKLYIDSNGDLVHKEIVK